MGEIVWEVRQKMLSISESSLPMGNLVPSTLAVAGESVLKPQYVKTKIGALISSVTDIAGFDKSIQNRFINGDVLTGESDTADGHLDFYNNLLTIIPEEINTECLDGYLLLTTKFQPIQNLFVLVIW